MEWTTESFFAPGSASDLLGSWEMLLLSIFSNTKVLGIPPQIIHCNFFGSFLYTGTVCLTSSLLVSAAVTVLGKGRQ